MLSKMVLEDEYLFCGKSSGSSKVMIFVFFKYSAEIEDISDMNQFNKLT